MKTIQMSALAINVILIISHHSYLCQESAENPQTYNSSNKAEKGEGEECMEQSVEEESVGTHFEGSPDSPTDS